MKLQLNKNKIKYGPISTKDILDNEYNIKEYPSCPYCGDKNPNVVKSKRSINRFGGDYFKIFFQCTGENCDCQYSVYVDKYSSRQ